MVFEKIFLLWQQSVYAFVRLPLTTWFGLLFLHMQRFYYALVTSYAFVPFLLFILSAFFVKNSLIITILMLCVISLSIYCMRPTIGLKNISYLRDYFLLENLTCSGAIIFFFTVLAAILPKLFLGLLFVFAVTSFSFLYDTAGSIPDRVGYALVRTCYFMLYKLPVIFFLLLLTTLVVYIKLGSIGLVLKMLFVYPLLSALVTILYVSALHDNYELYYAE